MGELESTTVYFPIALVLRRESTDTRLEIQVPLQWCMDYAKQGKDLHDAFNDFIERYYPGFAWVW